MTIVSNEARVNEGREAEGSFFWSQPRTVQGTKPTRVDRVYTYAYA